MFYYLFIIIHNNAVTLIDKGQCFVVKYTELKNGAVCYDGGAFYSWLQGLSV